MGSQLTEANLRTVSGKTRAEQEEELWQKMQTISELLGKVDVALETASSAPPGTGQSQRPQSRRQTPALGAPPSAAPPSAGPPSAAPPSAASHRTGVSVRSTLSQRGRAPEAPQLAVIHDDPPPSSAKEEPIKLVSYTGMQSHVAGIQARRYNSDARAAQSSIGSVLGWDAPR